MKKITILFALMLATLVGCQKWTPEKGVDKFADKMKSELKLNGDQTAKLNDLTGSMKEFIQQDMAKKSAMKDDIKGMIESPKLDTAKLTSIMKDHQAEMNRHMEVLTPKLAAFHDSLSDDQRKKAADKFEEFSKHWAQ
jgi:hypothetical protein